ncbi:MAG: AI-2E family transporter [Cellulosilyticaceae bacterium]
MKIEKNNKYFTIAAYTVATVVVIMVLAFMLLRIQVIGGYLVNIIKKVFTLFAPLLFGFIIAYLMDPLVAFYDKRCGKLPTWHQKKKVGGATEAVGNTRVLPTLLAFLTFIAFLGLIILIVVINVRDVMGVLQHTAMNETLENYVAAFHNLLRNVDEMANDIPFVQGHIEVIGKIYGFIEQFIDQMSLKVVALLKGIGGQLISIGLGIVIAFYLLQDKKKLLIIWQRLLLLFVPKSIRNEVMDIGRDIDYVFSGYIRGQLIDAVIMGTLISIALTCIGIDFAIIIGIISGIFNLIPYFGPVVGFVLAGFIGFIGGEPQKGIYAVLAVVALQQLDGWVIVPHIMGETVKLHPIVVLLAIVIGGQLWGLVGFLLAVPAVGFIRLLIIRYMGDVFSGKEQ